MKYCSKCGKEMSEEATFCPNCGSNANTPVPDKKENDCRIPRTKYCSTCGAELREEAVVCTACGCAQNSPQANANTKKEKSGLKTAAKVFMILSCIVQGLYLIPLAWCLPMTIHYSNKCDRNEPVGVGFKICTLLFVNLIAGILMLCDSSNN